MKILADPRAAARLIEGWRARGLTVGFVPTMGALHAGHLSLVARARARNARVVLSIFVNPKQFGPNEDFSRYPRPFRRDAALCRGAGVDLLYRPPVESLYPPGFKTFVEVTELSSALCGRFRPGHFRGVATVVLKLLARLRPHRLYLGEKDFQQLVILRRMAQDLELPVEIVGCPTVREADGLAVSSRNIFLSPAERKAAPLLHRALERGAEEARRPGASVARILRRLRREIRKLPGARVDYMEVVDAGTLERPGRIEGCLRLLGAVRLGNTRLIDNIPFFV